MSATYFAYLGECVRTSVIRSFCLQLFVLGSTLQCVGYLPWIFAHTLFTHSLSYLLVISYLSNKVNAILGLENHLFLVDVS